MGLEASPPFRISESTPATMGPIMLANLRFQKLPTQKDSTNLEASRLPNFFGAFGLMLTGLIIVHSVPGPGLFWNVHQHQGLYMEAAQNHAFDGLAF